METTNGKEQEMNEVRIRVRSRGSGRSATEAQLICLRKITRLLDEIHPWKHLGYHEGVSCALRFKRGVVSEVQWVFDQATLDDAQTLDCLLGPPEIPPPERWRRDPSPRKDAPGHRANATAHADRGIKLVRPRKD